jgi:mono/diheme cytochrome c family protein
LTRLGLTTIALAVAVIPTAHLWAGEAPGSGAPAAASTEQIKHGRQLFNDWSCSTCHALKDASASGSVGPSLDGDSSLTAALVVDRVTNGQGAMPGFGGQMTDQEIADLAAYVVAVKK